MNFNEDLNNLKIKWKNKGYYESDLIYNILDFGIIIMFIIISTFLENGIISGIFLGTAIHQSCRLGHELGHRSGIFNVTRIKNENIYNYLLLLINIFLGFDGFLWKLQHTQHHEYTMYILDCQIDTDYPPVFTHHIDFYKNKIKSGNILEKILLPYQHNLGLLLVILFGKINLSIKYFTEIENHNIILRKSMLLLHYFIIFYLCFDRYIKYNIFNVIQYIFMINFMCGILHLQLLFSHITTEHHNNPNKNDIKQQIIHSINYKCKPNGFWHWFHVSLAHQIEHHIDPKISSQHQHKITNDVIKLCNDYNIQYKSEDFIEILIKYRKILKEITTK